MIPVPSNQPTSPALDRWLAESVDDQPFNTLPLPSPPTNPTDLEGAGVVCETKRFDSFYNSSGDRIVLPAGQKYTASHTRAYKSALVVTTFWNREQDLEKVLEIRSPHMKAALKSIVPEYHSFNINTKHITITCDPWCLFHYRQELLDHGAELHGHDMEAAQHIQHLISYMWDALAVEILAFSAVEWPLGYEPSLEFKYLWMLFRPQSIVLFDTEIFTYDGVKPLKDLPVLPFDLLTSDEKQTAKERLVTRGRRFAGIHGQQCFWYNGKSDKSSGGKVKTRIISDRGGYIDLGPGSKISLSSSKRKFKPEDTLKQMSEEDLMICSPTISGYSLKDNKWAIFDVDSLSDITFDSQAFDGLILPPGKGRGMIFLLYGDTGVGKTLTAESVADFCQKPLLRLDAGTLGTSASSMEKGLKDAFRLAERWHALLLLDEADVYLEQSPKVLYTMELSLVSSLPSSCSKHRSTSVFLRMLEYYHGILFLTTNRISSFDRAFVSRIHLAIHYPPLSQQSRQALLYNFLKQTSEDSADALSGQGVLDKLAAEDLNGRQIKNLVRTACALALSEDSTHGRVEERHLELALQPMKEFAQTMEKVLIRDQQEPAQDEEEDDQQVEDQPSEDQEEGSKDEDEDENENEVEEGASDSDNEPETEHELEVEVEEGSNSEGDEQDEQDEQDGQDGQDEDIQGEEIELPEGKRRRLI
ncbi:P-loop containing protein [Fusarium mundagurra]|uniref:P-loop containing protein n=1 Tax=Fusarium mundagurra TaxID=1567541 RepID=A0A8H5YQW6_9HYPO|nr:P-loop containing protein [Fusarium mundagurra]